MAATSRLPETSESDGRQIYQRWIEECEQACLAELSAPQPGQRPIVPQRLAVVLLPGRDSAAALVRLLEHCPDECHILALVWDDDPAVPVPLNGKATVREVSRGSSPADALATAIHHLDADLVCFLDPQERLDPSALSLMAEAAARHPQTDILFADEDWMAGDQRERPFLKPGWDAELQRSRDLLGPFTFFRAALVRGATVQAGSAWLYDLANQIIRTIRPERIQHVPAVLCHRRAPPPPPAAMSRAAEAGLRREGIAARVEPMAGMAHRVVYHLQQPKPLVSVIVPTRDRAELMATCADALLRRTDYDRLELLVVDNGSTDAEAQALLDQLARDRRVRVLRQPGPFNWSALNNYAAGEARGDILLLLNNDIDALRPDWLSVLVSHAVQPGVGAVGLKLLYPDGRVQHAGLTTDTMGVPRHLFRYAAGDSPGLFDLMATARTVWAVTGACLAIRRDVFYAVGSLNEALPIAGNDVDLCLRLTACGYRIVWTPWAALEHRELASRQPDHTPERRDAAREELDRLLRDWGPLMRHDPFLNRNLHLENEQPCFGRARA